MLAILLAQETQGVPWLEHALLAVANRLPLYAQWVTAHVGNRKSLGASLQF